MSKQTLKQAMYSVGKLFEKSESISFATRYDYQTILKSCLQELYQANIQLPSIENLKQKHIKQLISSWQEKALSIGTIKNRLSAIRFAVNTMGKPNMLPSDNKLLNIPSRKIITGQNRAIHQVDIQKITDKYVQFSLRLQQEFGLRRQEAIKFMVSLAEKDNHIALKASWTKGGIAREVPVTTESQRQLLNELHCFCKKGESLIPKEKNYKAQLNAYTYHTREAGIKNPHGLRHAYAQRRYRILTDKMTNGFGWEAPLSCGKSVNDLSNYQKRIDKAIREIISNELGHSRVDILRQYGV